MVISAGSYTVGIGGDYPTWNLAFDDIDAAGLSGDLTFTQISDVIDTSPIQFNFPNYLFLDSFTLLMASDNPHMGDFNAGWLWERANGSYRFNVTGTGLLEVRDIRVDGRGGTLTFFTLGPSLKVHDVLMQRPSIVGQGSVSVGGAEFEFYNNIISIMDSSLSASIVSIRPSSASGRYRVFNNVAHTNTNRIGFSINPGNLIYTDLKMSNNIAIVNTNLGWHYQNPPSAELLAGMLNNASTDATLPGTIDSVESYTPADEFISTTFGDPDYLKIRPDGQFALAGVSADNPTTVDIAGAPYGLSPPIGAYVALPLAPEFDDRTTIKYDNSFYQSSSLIDVSGSIYTCSPRSKEIVEVSVNDSGDAVIASRSGTLDSAPHDMIELNGFFYAVTDDGLYNFRDKIINKPTNREFLSIDPVICSIDGHIVISANRTIYLIDSTLGIKAFRLVGHDAEVLAIIDNYIYSIRRDGYCVILRWDNILKALDVVDIGKFPNVKNVKRAVVFVKSDQSDKILQLVMQNYGITTIDMNDPVSPVFRSTTRYESPNDITHVNNDAVFVSSDDYLDDYQVTFPVNWSRGLAELSGRILVIAHSDIGRLTFSSEYEGAPPPLPPVIPPLPPTDMINSWDMSQYITPLNDSYQLPREVVVDSMSGVNLTVTNPLSNGSDISRVVRIEHSCSAPDGLGGMYFVERFKQLVGDLNERVKMVSSSPIDFIADGSFSLGGWINPSFEPLNTASPAMRQTLFSQGYSVADGMRVYVSVNKTVGVGNRATIIFSSQFSTSGPATLNYLIPGDAHAWHMIRVQQNASTMEIWVDGILAASLSPVGASGINISNDTNFFLGGDYIETANPSDWMGGIGQLWTRYNRMLNASENLLWYTSAQNFNFVSNRTIDDDGSFGEEMSNNTFTQWTWGADRKTATVELSVRTKSLLTTPIKRTAPPVEMQFRIDSVSSGWMFGVSSEAGSASAYLGQSEFAWGMHGVDRRVYSNNVGSGPTGPSIVNGDVGTLRCIPTATGFDLVWLVNNIVHRTQTIAFSWDNRNSLRFAVGNLNAVIDTMKILTNESEFAYPVGAGFTTLDMI